MNRVEVDAKDVEPPSWLPAIEPFCVAVLRSLDILNWELSILFCNDDTMRDLNRTWRGIDAPTDVLSFSQLEEENVVSGSEDGSVYAGDIVISLDTLDLHSKLFSVAHEEELKRLLIHGILHLAGYDHETNEGSEPMLTLQEEIVKTFSGVRLF